MTIPIITTVQTRCSRCREISPYVSVADSHETVAMADALADQGWLVDLKSATVLCPGCQLTPRCVIDGCERPRTKRFWCSRHFYRGDEA